ncbi:T9SS type A sorting domain-containing protein [Flavobacterium sp.]|uniref:T9SS type A sorting domain-containing protein n=1 Tax=Flavobacterium sp. TaxID=239 RepID=UPI00374D4794
MKKNYLFLALLASTISFSQTPLLSSTTPITPYLVVNSPVGEEIGKIIDGDINTKFSDTNINDGMGFQVNVSSNPQVAIRIDITLSNNIPNRDPQNFQLLGSNDGIIYTSIYNGIIICGQPRNTVISYSFVNTITYGYYRVNFTNLCGPQSTFQVAEVQIYANTLSLSDSVELNDFTFFPNPIQNFLTIRNIKKIPLTEIQVSDLTGKIVKSFELNNSNDNQQLDLNNIASGMYIMKIKSNNKIFLKKILLK